MKYRSSGYVYTQENKPQEVWMDSEGGLWNSKELAEMYTKGKPKLFREVKDDS